MHIAATLHPPHSQPLLVKKTEINKLIIKPFLIEIESTIYLTRERPFNFPYHQWTRCDSLLRQSSYHAWLVLLQPKWLNSQPWRVLHRGKIATQWFKHLRRLHQRCLPVFHTAFGNVCDSIRPPVVMYSRRIRASNISTDAEIASTWQLPGPAPIDPSSHSFDLKLFIHKRTVGVNESYSGVVNIVTRWRGRGSGFVNRASYLRARRKCIT